MSVLLIGETGVGKEVAAHMIHERSPRAAGPFIKINCAALPENLIESELFGYERGAFTGAQQPKKGLLEAACAGTLFLDEVGELPPGAQAKLLRAVESREIIRLGGVGPRVLDVRFVSATNRNLDAHVARGAFRQDLFYRLNGVSITIPPLRERRDEIASLAVGFVAAAAAAVERPVLDLAPGAIALLERYDWPGNVRELKNAVERAVALCEHDVIGPEHLPPALCDAPTPPAEADLREEIHALERRRIVEALEKCAGHQGRAAEMLGISRRTLLMRLDAFGLPRPRKGQKPPRR
jgi:transcriptional regulator with PAS, ATPase and Fis domain